MPQPERVPFIDPSCFAKGKNANNYFKYIIYCTRLLLSFLPFLSLMFFLLSYFSNNFSTIILKQGKCCAFHNHSRECCCFSFSVRSPLAPFSSSSPLLSLIALPDPSGVRVRRGPPTDGLSFKTGKYRLPFLKRYFL